MKKIIIQLEVDNKIIREETAKDEVELYKYYLLLRKDVQDSVFKWAIYVTREVIVKGKMDSKLRYRMLKTFIKKGIKNKLFTQSKIKLKNLGEPQNTPRYYIYSEKV